MTGLPVQAPTRAWLSRWPEEDVRALIETATRADVEAALQKERRGLAELAAFLSPHAKAYLEPMARLAQGLTRRYFGRTIGLYAPLYISNLCAADCVYCGFSVRNPTRDRRVTLRPDAIRRECEALAQRGFGSVLLLTGESPKAVPVAYIAEAVAIAREFFPSVSAEVYACTEAEYRQLVHAGLEGLTLYMETYHRPTYADVHLEGDKTDYDFRLEATERAGRAGVRKLSIGALLGLYDWRCEACWTALHAWRLQRLCWQSSLSISFPRLRHTPDRYAIASPVSDSELVQLMLAMRLVLPEAGFNASTREPAAFRDRLIPLGVTHMSAGSSTQPGGYRVLVDDERGVLEQFSIDDHRPPHEVAAAIRGAGYDPVWKDYDRAFDCA